MSRSVSILNQVKCVGTMVDVLKSIIIVIPYNKWNRLSLVALVVQ